MPRALNLDSTDHLLLERLQQDSSTTLFEIGTEIGLSTSAVQRRIARFRRAGLIDREIAVLSPRRFPEVVLALVMVTLEKESSTLHSEMESRFLACPSVQQCYDLAGEYDYAVLLAARGMDALRDVVEDLFSDTPELRRFDTFVIYRALRRGLGIPTETQ